MSHLLQERATYDRAATSRLGGGTTADWTRSQPGTVTYAFRMARIAKIRWSFAVLGVVLVAGLTGCGSTSVPAEQGETATTSASLTDADACVAFGDVGTIVSNADAGFRDQRMEAQERDGWYRLATRVLDRIKTADAGPVQDALNELKKAAPAVKLGAVLDVDFDSAAWVSAQAALTEACDEVGVEMATEAFTGG